jgi:hypothetical protein
MWTTSSSPASVSGLATSVVAALGCCVACAQVAPDAPRPARMSDAQPRASVPAAGTVQTLELTSVAVRPLDDYHRRMGGAQLLKDARDPVVIEVRTERPMPPVPRSASPVIVLNGERLHNTWVILPNTLVAIVPDRSVLKDENQVLAEWVGNAAATRSRIPLVWRYAR